MFEDFCEYMYYLLISPFKKVKKKINQWHILFGVLGKYFDDAMESLYSAGEQTMLATCDPVMLQVHADERHINRYAGEEIENFRARIAMYGEICRLGGTNQGILLAVKTLGFEDVEIKTAKELKGNPERWAEFYVLIRMELEWPYPISFDILKKNVRIWKEVGAKDNYQFIFQSTDLTGRTEDTCRIVLKETAINENRLESKTVFHLKAENTADTELGVEIKNNLWYLDGTYGLDGIKLLNAYEMREKL